MQNNNIVMRAQSGKLMMSPEKTTLMEREVSSFLGCISKQFQSGVLTEDHVFNMDETHFCVNMDNGKTLTVRGHQEVKYADVSSGGVGMTMVVLISGGPASSIRPPMMIFQNENRSYPIRGLPDDVPGVSYRTGPKGWMDRTVLVQWLRERRAISSLPENQKMTIFMDNCTGHTVTDNCIAALADLNAEIVFFPKN